MKNKDYSISLVRMVATIFVVACHFMSAPQIKMGALALWFYVGVQMFLFLSGYLYGNKKIETVSFYKKNAQKILVDYYVYLFILFAVILITGIRQIEASNMIRLLSLTGQMEGVLHLWYVPYILFCYCITPIFSAVTEEMSKKTPKVLLLQCILLAVFLQFAGDYFVRSFRGVRIYCYVLGLLMAKVENRNKQTFGFMVKLMYVSCVVLNGSQILVDSILKYSFESELFARLYQHWCNHAHITLGITLVILIRNAYRRWEISTPSRGGAFLALLNFSDKYSYDVYLVHQFYILGAGALLRSFKSNFIGVCIVSIVIVLSAVALNYIAQLVRQGWSSLFKVKAEASPEEDKMTSPEMICEKYVEREAARPDEIGARRSAESLSESYIAAHRRSDGRCANATGVKITVDGGRKPGGPKERRLRRLEKEVIELRRSNQILQEAIGIFAAHRKK